MNQDMSLYSELGYVVLPDFLRAEEIAGLRNEGAAILRGQRGTVRGLSSARTDESDNDLLRRNKCIHFPHKISPSFYQSLFHPKVVEIMKQIIGPNVKAMESMFFSNGPGLPGQAWHQDEWYIPTRDRSLATVWLALDDIDVQNGALRVVPGSHSAGILWRTRPNGDPAEWGQEPESFGFPATQEEVCEVRAGTAIFFSGYLVHGAMSNRSAHRTRCALVNHYMSAESPLPWDWDGRIPPTKDNRDIVLVCGEDPYEWKGLQDNHWAYMRALSPDDPEAPDHCLDPSMEQGDRGVKKFAAARQQHGSRTAPT